MVPAPVLPALALAVIASELSPLLALIAALVIAAAAALARGRTRIASTSLGCVALGLALVPLATLPGTIRACEIALGAATGRTASPGDSDAAAPFVPAYLVRPFVPAPAGAVRYALPVSLRGGGRLAFDLYRAARPGPRPTVVLLYGGAWQFGTRADVAPLCRRLAALGYTAVAAEYRLAPGSRFPAQLDDVRDALAALAARPAALGVDPRRVALFGESAGAELALVAAYRPEPVRIGAVIGVYPPLDLRRGYREPPAPDPADVRALLRTFLGGTPEERAAAYVAASPRSYVRAGLPPTLLIGGTRDELVRIDFQREMARALRAQGDRVAALEFPWSNHGFAALPGGLGGQLATYYGERFLRETVGDE